MRLLEKVLCWVVRCSENSAVLLLGCRVVGWSLKVVLVLPMVMVPHPEARVPTCSVVVFWLGCSHRQVVKKVVLVLPMVRVLTCSVVVSMLVCRHLHVVLEVVQWPGQQHTWTQIVVSLQGSPQSSRLGGWQGPLHLGSLPELVR